MFQQGLDIGVEQILLQQDGEIGPECREEIWNKDPLVKNSLTFTPWQRRSSCWKGQIALQGVAILAQGYKG